MNEYKIFVGKDTKDYFDAILANQFNPSEENKKRLDKISSEITDGLKKSQQKNEEVFLSKYGNDLFDFIKGISKEYFLVGQSEPFYLSWDVKSDSENDDYWTVRFYKGNFRYQLDICGGYGGHEILEDNISVERVKELLFPH